MEAILWDKSVSANLWDKTISANLWDKSISANLWDKPISTYLMLYDKTTTSEKSLSHLWLMSVLFARSYN